MPRQIPCATSLTRLLSAKADQPWCTQQIFTSRRFSSLIVHSEITEYVFINSEKKNDF
jgi:hypothetical protein